MTGLKVVLIDRWYSKGKNDADLAKIIGVDHALVSRWINGKANPTMIRKIQIAHAIGVDSRLIFPIEGEK